MYSKVESICALQISAGSRFISCESVFNDVVVGIEGGVAWQLEFGPVEMSEGLMCMTTTD